MASPEQDVDDEVMELGPVRRQVSQLNYWGNVHTDSRSAPCGWDKLRKLVCEACGRNGVELMFEECNEKLWAIDTTR